MAAESAWMIRAKKADFYGIAKKHSIDPVTARLLVNRGLETDEDIRKYLYGDVKDCYDPALMKDMEAASCLIKRKIYEHRKIRVIGDYDVDGICSTFILVTALKEMGAYVDYDIPDRIKDGYGLNERLVREAAKDGVDTVLTCDNGIAAREQIKLAKELGMTVVITDHHEIPVDESGNEVVPEADAVIDPHQKSCHYPEADICGAFVALKFIQYMLGKTTGDMPGPMLEAAGLATVCDVMPLKGENRLIVKEALRLMEHSGIAGIRALLKATGLSEGALSSYHFGFVIGPCLNASGRLASAKKALDLLFCETEEEAALLAEELKTLNETRKSMTEDGLQKAREYMETHGIEKDPVYVIHLPECHESLAGIIAGKIKEEYCHPVFVFTGTTDILKGSGRSIEHYPMFEKLCECSRLLVKFGGHPMAAGLSVKAEDLEPLRKKLNENAGLTEHDFAKKIMIDVAMPVSYATEDLIREISLLEPFGTGNEKPVFAQKGLSIRAMNLIGKTKNTLKMTVSDERGSVYPALKFREGAEMFRKLAVGDMISVVYEPNLNEYNGKKTIQMIVSNIRK